MLQADLDQLAKLATTLTDVGKQIKGLQIRTVSDRLPDALPGCKLGPACKQAGDSTEQAWKQVTDRIDKLAASVKTSSTNLKLTDDDFAKSLHAFDFRTESAH